MKFQTIWGSMSFAIKVTFFYLSKLLLLTVHISFMFILNESISPRLAINCIMCYHNLQRTKFDNKLVPFLLNSSKKKIGKNFTFFTGPYTSNSLLSLDSDVS